MKGQTNQDGTDGLLMSSLDPAPAVAQDARSCIAGLAGAGLAGSEADQQARTAAGLSIPLVEFIQTKHSLQDTTVSNTTIAGLHGKLATMATDQPFFWSSTPVLGIVTAARRGRTMNKYAIPNYCWLATREDLPALFGGFSDLVQAILSPNINLSTVSILADALAGTFGGTQKEWEGIVEQTIWVERQVPGKAAPKVLRRSFKTHDEAFDALHAACSQEMQQRLGASRQQFDDLITL
ncbi:hypothetical protein CAOG_08316 [Capsaspora owczarzaki ATCC 30864]|uniref:Uncharacterized protein n=1 Tax=Capsaspora owczarzaki (strain ATCC 30864) TaxID=595528 RepID=A0A0D2UTN7_CAPO3|nr:hypothetical protein CAOG_08316 [Capsaspora owczarzaki ATCC 30864]KJE98351.1 hypothetical protein CAOG_008316 [Capsaspora owczarzaki ATCC 30864]|eukprot:XP_004341261.1 hypothetical protein CAOG_08316 [Capsaspora owczarzaki ATCC 30864]